MSILNKIFGDPNEKTIKQLQPIIDEINGLEGRFEKMNDEELKAQTVRFQEEIKNGKTLDDVMPEAFAVVREASKRVIGQRHYDVQIMAAIILHRGQITEMKTGEGKTLVATCPIYLNALSGKGSHLVTVNDYLSRIHADWMGRIYSFLGLTIGCVQQQGLSYKFNPTLGAQSGDEQLDVQFLERCSRKEAYNCDITYGTNNEFGFDYLRDNMVLNKTDMVQRDLNFAIVDEVDSILIDEARTPLIISAPDMESTDKYYQFAQIVNKLKEGDDYNIDEKMRAATLTEEGISKVEKILGVENIYTERGIGDVHHIEQSLKANTLFKKDRDYVIKDGEIVIIDEFTGRMMFGRRYSEGLHQAIEAKENVKVQRESKTLASITFQNYFRLYTKLSGMTGTAVTEAEEFSKIYDLETIVIPTNNPIVRKDLNDKIYKSETGKFQALVNEIKERNSVGQPVLVGTISIEKNELLADLLAKEGVDCQVLNAKQHDREAHIIAQAGKVGSVTVATNMAGRGVDIILGGYPYDKEEYQKVVDAGGLCVLGTERHESRRIDNQLRGRSGRQGDPGLSQFFISMDDDLMRIFGSSRMKSMMETLRVPDDMPIENKIISKSIETAQKKVEGNHFDMRKHLVEYDDVMNKQRETIYKKRRLILDAENLKELVFDAIKNEIISVVRFHTQEEDESRWDLKEIYDVVGTIFPLKEENRIAIDKIDNDAGDYGEDHVARSKIIGYLTKLAANAYNSLEENINKLPGTEDGLETMREVERGMLLRIIDTLWIEHLASMQYMRTGIGLRGYGQRDPLVEYKREAFNMFRELLGIIDKQITYSIFKIGFVTPGDILSQSNQSQNIKLSGAVKTSGEKSPMVADQGLEERKEDRIVKNEKSFDGEKVGRNDPCPCGAKKSDGRPVKFKNCHGK